MASQKLDCPEFMERWAAVAIFENRFFDDEEEYSEYIEGEYIIPTGLIYKTHAFSVYCVMLLNKSYKKSEYNIENGKIKSISKPKHE